MRYLLALSLGLCALIPAPQAHCVYCPTHACFGRCSSRCVCMRTGPGGGQCVSFERARELGFRTPEASAQP